MNKTLTYDQFNHHVGFIVVAQMMQDYITLVKCDYSPKELSDKYMVNKCKDVEKPLETLLKNVSRGIVTDKTRELIQKDVDRNFMTIYDVLALSEEEQNRVNQLIKKIKKERK